MSTRASPLAVRLLDVATSIIMCRPNRRTASILCAFLAIATGAACSLTAAQAPNSRTLPFGVGMRATRPPADAQVTPPAGYVIGLEDVLGVVFWKDESMSGDFTVRPDGRISVPLLNDIEVVGLTPDQLRVKLLDLATKYVTEPNVTVVVRTINSRKVYITGQVTRPGSYPLAAPTTVLQLIALGGGLSEFAAREEITIIRPGQQEPLKFNYEDVRKGENLQQNVELQPGDTVIVP